MRAVIQRVKSAKVTVNGQVISSIGPGILTLLGVERNDTDIQLEKLISKILDLRIFQDSEGKMNLSLKDIQGSHLIVSQFTLLGDCSQGRRPSFVRAEEPVRAKQLYERALKLSEMQNVRTYGGQFQADMEVELINDGPVTLVLDL